MARQVQISDHLGIEQRYRVRGHGIAKAGVKFLGHGRAAYDAASFEHGYFEAGRSQIGRAHQPVVAAADNHDIARF